MGLDCSGFRNYSQDDLDGRLLYIFAAIGFESKIGIELACGYPEGSNLANLILNWDWDALLLDANDDAIYHTQKFYNEHSSCNVFPPKIKHTWITKENINEILSEAGLPKEIDLLSLDVDGVDYWLFDSLQTSLPRVLVVEYLDFWENESVTIPYAPSFNRFDHHEDFFGASLPAWTSLCETKGYRLIGCPNWGFNAIFLKKDIGVNEFPTTTAQACLKRVRLAARNQRFRRREVIKDMPWVRLK